MSAPGKTVRWNIKVSKETDRAVRAFLGSRGRTRGDLSKFVEEAVRWHLFHQTVREARAGFANLPADELQKIIDEAVADVRAKRSRHRAKRPVKETF